MQNDFVVTVCHNFVYKNVKELKYSHNALRAFINTVQFQNYLCLVSMQWAIKRTNFSRDTLFIVEQRVELKFKHLGLCKSSA